MKRPAQTVDQFLAELDHPMKAEILALRGFILDLDPSITEEVKWNAPSFRTREHFATMQLRRHDQLLLILHLGAKKREQPVGAVGDPAGLLHWLGPDRASVSFSGMQDLHDKQPALALLIREWLEHV